MQKMNQFKNLNLGKASYRQVKSFGCFMPEYLIEELISANFHVGKSEEKQVTGKLKILGFIPGTIEESGVLKENECKKLFKSRLQAS